MADEGFDLCECIWSHELAMQHLLSILRQSQNYCMDNECFIPWPSEAPPTTNFFITSIIIAFIILMYVLRPNSLRQLRYDTGKDRDNERNSSGGPPASPPTGQ